MKERGAKSGPELFDLVARVQSFFHWQEGKCGSMKTACVEREF